MMYTPMEHRDASTEGFDVLVAGAELAGSVMAERLATQIGLNVLIVDQRPPMGGNANDRHDDAGLLMHPDGPHIFHANCTNVFDYLSQVTAWRPYQHRVLGCVEGHLLPIPIKLDTVNRLYGFDLTAARLETYFQSVAEPRLAMNDAEG